MNAYRLSYTQEGGDGPRFFASYDKKKEAKDAARALRHRGFAVQTVVSDKNGVIERRQRREP